MLCPNCGNEVDQGARFCTSCGEELPAPSGDAAQPADIPSVSQAAPAPSKSNDAKKRIIAVVLGCIVGIAVVGGGLYWKQHSDQQAGQEAQQAADQAHNEKVRQLVDVPIQIVAPNYTAGATRIPLHVTGSDLNDNAVDQTAYVDGQGQGLQLARGTYQVSVTASPILEDGSLYAIPDTVVNVSVVDGGDDASDTSAGQQDASAAPTVTADSSIAFTPVDPADVTDDMLAAAKQAASADDQSAEKVEALAQKTVQAREEAKYTVHGDSWTFIMPEYWRGKVEVTNGTEGYSGSSAVFWSTQYSINGYNAELLNISVLQNESISHFQVFPVISQGQTRYGTKFSIYQFDDGGMAALIPLSGGRLLSFGVQSPVDVILNDGMSQTDSTAKSYIAGVWDLMTLGQTSSPADEDQTEIASLQELAMYLTLE